MFSPLRPMDSRSKKLLVSFALFQRKYSPDERVNKTVATFEELTDQGKPTARDGIPPFVTDCNCTQM